MSKDYQQSESVILIKKENSHDQENYWQEYAQELEIILKNILNSVPYSIFWKDINGTYLGGNQLFSKSLNNLDIGQVIGHQAQDLDLPEDIIKIYQTNDQFILEKKLPLLNVIEPLIDENGEICLINSSKVPLLKLNGEAFGILGVYEDVTQTKKIEEELYIKSLLLDQIGDHVTIANLEGDITYVNQAKQCNNKQCYQGICGPIITNRPEYLDQCATEQEIIARTLETGSWRGEVIIQDLIDEKFIMDCRTQIIYNNQKEPIAIGSIAINITQEKIEKEILKKSEKKYRQIFENIQIVVFQIDMQGNLIEISPSITKFSGHTKEELLDRPVTNLYFNPNDQKILLQKLTHNQKVENYELKIKSKSGELIYANLFAQIITDHHGVAYKIEGVIKKITTKKIIEHALLESEEQFRLLITQMKFGIALHEIICDYQGKPIDYICLNINESYEKITGQKKEEILNKRASQLAPFLDQSLLDTYSEIALKKISKEFEYHDFVQDKDINVTAYCPKLGQFALILEDVTEKKSKQLASTYVGYHDPLTDLTNRRFYEKTLQELDKDEYFPLSIIMGDVNGLKLVNDSMGHAAGDQLLIKAAHAISTNCRSQDYASRIGGDEFTIILPQTSSEEAERIIKKIKNSTQQEKVGAVSVSISFGHGTKKNHHTPMSQVLKKAEDSMYHAKLFEGSSIKKHNITAILKTLYHKIPIEEKHSQRVAFLCEQMGFALNFSQKNVEKMKNIGLLHDIGKVGISTEVLNKTSSLSKEEWLEIKRHPEISYRILNTIDEMKEIALYILAHHERYDGKGYPKGLKGEEIPLEARIISIADAYEAMTSDRAYRPALLIPAALEELKKNARSQFDPNLVKIFIDKIINPSSK